MVAVQSPDCKAGGIDCRSGPEGTWLMVRTMSPASGLSGRDFEMAMPGISRGSRRSFRSSVRTIAAYIFRFSASLLSVPAPMKEIDLRAGAGGDPVPASCSGGETFSGCSVFDSAEAQSAPEPSKASEYLTAWFIMIGVFVVRCIVERITETSSASARFPRPGGS